MTSRASTFAAIASAIATGLAAWATFMQHDAQFSTALYGKQVELIGAAESAMGIYAGTVRKIIDVDHQPADYQKNEQAARHYMDSLLNVQLVLASDGRLVIDNVFRKVTDLQDQIHNAEHEDTIFKANAHQQQLMWNGLGDMMRTSGFLFTCGFDRFSTGHELKVGSFASCASSKA